MMSLTVFFGLGLLVPTPLRYEQRSLPKCRAGIVPTMCTPEIDAAVARTLEAAKRVVAAAELFGDVQGTAAKAWVAEALTGKVDDSSRLLDQQMTLFEDCVIDDDDGAKCKELDVALAGLEKRLNMGQDFGNKGLERAAVRVRNAAAKFGGEQAVAADEWLQGAKSNQAAANPALLLQSQVHLFDECLLDEDGGTSRCEELQEAIDALQKSLGVGGMVISTKGLVADASDDVE